MQMKNRRMLAAVLSAAILLSTCTTTNTWVYAQEESVGETETNLDSGSISDPVETEAPSETGESSISGIKIEEPQETETAAAEETEAETEMERQPQIANSWRYSNGELLVPNTYAVDDPNAWTKVDGFYVNNLGDPIKGAISRGIDVSSYQGSIDWEKVQADDVSFAILRCGYGDNWEIDIDEDGIYDQDDRYWEINAAACERLGIPYGTYFYSYAMNEEMVRSEAEHTIRLLEGKNLSYPIYLDLEQAELRTLDPEVLAEHVQLYFEILAEAGYTNVGVYANKDWFDNVLTDPYFDTVNKWVAQYNEECTYEGDYSMWQATSTGRIDGITGNYGYVDINFEMNEGPFVENGWIEKDGEVYYLLNSCPITNNFIFENGKWYYFDSEGKLQRSKWMQFDYGQTDVYFDATGARCFEWTDIGNDRYYITASGPVRSNFIFDGGKWYYFDSEGKLQRSKWMQFDYGQTDVYFDATGARCFGWTNIGDDRHYITASGPVRSNFIFDAGKWYYFDERGKLQRNKWMKFDDGQTDVYFGETGARCYGFTVVNGKTYYLTRSGMVKNNYIFEGGKSYYFDSQGVLQN